MPSGRRVRQQRAEPAPQDPFDTDSLRRAVLQTWAASPARFREDANAEEALTIGGYADRLLVELAANAVDAGREAGVQGRVRFAVHTAGARPELRATNTGAPLTPAGVSGLASLRASAKRGHGGTVGHFGVGFTAVLTVTDEPEVRALGGGVRFSAADTAAAVSALGSPAVDREVSERHGAVPVLRLPWPAPALDAAAERLPGFATQVRLPLRDGVLPSVIRLLESVGDELLWALPGLTTVEIELPGRPLRVLARTELGEQRTEIVDGNARTTYRWVTRSGTIPAALLADRPVEERGRNQWQVSWILSEMHSAETTFGLDPDHPVEPLMLGAPTPTDEPLSLPARLVGTFPVDDTRRRLAAGALTDYLLAQAADAYPDLVAGQPAAGRWALVPAAGFPLGPVDAGLRSAVLDRLARAPIALTVDGEQVAPTAACVVARISDQAAVLLGRAIPGLLLPPRSIRAAEAMRMLGVRSVPLADAVGALAGIDGAPSFWREVYEALADESAEDLATVPVPLLGGGRRIGPAGTLLPGVDSLDADLLRRAAHLAPGLRIVHPDAAHPVLFRWGAAPADAVALLADPALVALYQEFRDDLEDDDPDEQDLAELASLALDLAAWPAPAGGLLAHVVLTDADGQAWPATELLSPQAPLADVLAADADLPAVGARWLHYPEPVLAAVGVRTGLKVVEVQDVDADLPDLDRWWDEVPGDGPPPDPFRAVADLDLIDPEKWPAALAMLAADPDAMATLADGPTPAYTRWWLSRFVVLGGSPPHHWRLPGAVELMGWYDELPVPVEPGLARLIGVLGSAADATASDPAELVLRWSDPARRVTAAAVPALTGWVVDALERRADLPLPASVRALSGEVVDADEAAVLDLPWLAQVVAPGALVAGGGDPERVAQVLDLAVASRSGRSTGEAGELIGRGVRLTADQATAARAAASALGSAVDLGALRTVPDLEVRIDGVLRRVCWWGGVAGAAELFTDGTAAGIGRAVAWLCGRWADRARAVEAAAGDPATAAENGIEQVAAPEPGDPGPRHAAFLG